MSVPLPPGTGIENVDPEQIKTVRKSLILCRYTNYYLISVQRFFDLIQQINRNVLYRLCV